MIVWEFGSLDITLANCGGIYNRKTYNYHVIGHEFFSGVWEFGSLDITLANDGPFVSKTPQ